MIGWLAKKLKRAEMASDMMVLEKDPDSPRAAQIRAKYQRQEFERAVQTNINESTEIVREAMKIGNEESHKFPTIAEQNAEAERRVRARKRS